MILQQPFAIGGVIAGGYTRALTIDHTQVPSTQTNFPVLVNFTDNTFKTEANGGHVFGTNCFTFSSDSGGASLLKWEVERYNASTGEIVAWVKIASISNTVDTVFYLRYGSAITTDQSDAANVWTNSFLSVWHLKDGTTLNLGDSVGGITLVNNNTVTATTGQVDGGAGFASASNQYLSTPGTAPSAIAVTLSCWVKATTLPNDYNPAGINRGVSSADHYAMFVKNNGKMYMIVRAGNARSYDGTGSHTLSTGTWYYLALTYDSTDGLVGYVDGASDGTQTANGNATTDALAGEVGRQRSTGTRYWNGSQDEVRVASVARSANWIACEHNNQKSGQTFVALGSET